MRAAYVHQAVLLLEGGADDREPGAAVTMALCGSWNHPGQCPLAPHHTATHRDGNELVVRVIFAVEGQDEQSVRHQIVAALESGRSTVPDHPAPGWRLVHHRAEEQMGDELDQAGRLAKQ